MVMALVDTVRNALLTEISLAADAGPAAAIVRIYDGVRPAKGGAVTTLLAECTMSDPAFAAPAGGVMSANSIADETSTPNAGDATWFRIVDSTGSFILDGDVGVTSSGAELELPSITIPLGSALSITSLTLTAGNA